MKKRIAVLVLVGLLAVAAGGFALKSTPDFGIGAELSSINIDKWGGMLVLHIPKVPLYFGLGANFLEGAAWGAGITRGEKRRTLNRYKEV